MTRALVTATLLLMGLALQPDPIAAQGEWRSGEAMPTARSEFAAAELGGRLYVAGGIAQFGTTDAFEVYDPESDSWRELAPLPEAAHHLGLAALDGRIYTTGGYADLRFRPDRKAAWVYDPEADAWEKIADMPGLRAAHRLVALDCKIHVVGGVGPDSTALWAYDPATDAWDESLAPLPTAREHLAVAVAEDELYVIAGRRKGEGNLSVVEAYDPAADSWRRISDLPAPRGGHTAASIQGRIHVTGGEDLDAGVTFAEHWVYDPAADRWDPAPAMPTARHGVDSAAIAGRWYVPGGGKSAGYWTILSLTSRLEIYTPE